VHLARPSSALSALIGSTDGIRDDIALFNEKLREWEDY
jgi:hypothetical protein